MKLNLTKIKLYSQFQTIKMKKLLFLFAILFSTSIFAQQTLTGAMGLEFGMSESQAKQIMSNRAGFEFYKENPINNTVSYTNGIFAGRQCVGAILHFYNHKLHTIVVLVESKPEAKTLDLYNEVIGELQVRYNLIPKEYHNYRSPYSAGDGYTLSAIKLGYADLTTLFAFGDSNVISVNITQSLSLKLTYQHTELAGPAIDAQSKEKSKDY